MFRRLLIANRGEIALRIIRACGELGVETVAVYSEADRGAPWLRRADATVCLGPGRAEASYLDADAILQAALQTDCQALHPGYGFLAENAIFAARCQGLGISFVGPTPAAIRRMGNKVEARRTMARAGLPTIPGSDGMLPNAEEARRAAAGCGYPVLLKASAGGGGKGMRRCDSEGEIDQAFGEAAHEARSAFGDGTLYLEKFVVGGRHIEFQLLCDGFGRAIHLGERECSIQRKHQKLVEESPSPAVDPATRGELGGRVARAAAGLGYSNVGTIEFLRDTDGSFYFMEMNTRLQVEHPVTEMVTGIDLVAEQLRVAANQPLSVEQAQLSITGHAIEFRINAEDPAADFRPDPGTIERVALEPAPAGVTVRWDSAIESGYRIPPHYDSMIGKLIVHGTDRQAAIEGARAALSGLRIDGVKTTIPFHQLLLGDPEFVSGQYDVDRLARGGLSCAPGCK